MCFGMDSSGKIVSGYTGKVDWNVMNMSDKTKGILVPWYNSNNNFYNNNFNYLNYPWQNNHKTTFPKEMWNRY